MIGVKLQRGLICLLLVVASGCQLSTELLPRLGALPTATPAPAWDAIAAGIEWRKFIPDGDELAQLIVIRIDPRHYHFRALYQPGQPRRISEWRDHEPDALIIINANFFDEDHQAIGAIISDGQVYGHADRYTGGSFLVRDGAPMVMRNQGNDPITAATSQLVQGWPLLVDGGNPSYVAWSARERTRRSMIAEDSSGNILIIIAPWLSLPLPDLSEYLSKAGLNILRALNLDGGGSTMLAIPSVDYLLPSFDPVPAVLALYPR